MAENRWVNPYFSPEVHPEIPGVTSRAPRLLRRSSSRRSSLASLGSRPESPCCLGMTPGLSVVGTDDGRCWVRFGHEKPLGSMMSGTKFYLYWWCYHIFFYTSVGKDTMDPMDYGRHYLKTYETEHSSRKGWGRGWGEKWIFVLTLFFSTEVWRLQQVEVADKRKFETNPTRHVFVFVFY